MVLSGIQTSYKEGEERTFTINQCQVNQTNQQLGLQNSKYHYTADLSLHRYTYMTVPKLPPQRKDFLKLKDAHGSMGAQQCGIMLFQHPCGLYGQQCEAMMLC